MAFEIGRTLSGGLLGMKGVIRSANLVYDVSLGTPFFKLNGFKTDPTYVAFSLNWQY